MRYRAVLRQRAVVEEEWTVDVPGDVVAPASDDDVLNLIAQAQVEGWPLTHTLRPLLNGETIDVVEFEELG